MTSELEARLSQYLSAEQWEALKTECLSNGIPLEENDLFVMVKYWFVLGWDAGSKPTKA